MILNPADQKRVLDLARQTLNDPAHRAVVQIVADNLNARPRESMDLLGSHLAYAYAQGYVRGWRRRERERGEVIPFTPPEAI